jgi:hypothetical protein
MLVLDWLPSLLQATPAAFPMLWELVSIRGVHDRPKKPHKRPIIVFQHVTRASLQTGRRYPASVVVESRRLFERH